MAEGRGGRRVRVPGYAFQRQRHWIEARGRRAAGRAAPAGAGVAALVAAGDADALRARLMGQVAPAHAAAVEAVVTALVAEEARAQTAALVGGWLYGLAWERAAAPNGGARASGSWVVLADRTGLGEAVAARLEAGGGRVIRVYAGEGPAQGTGATWTVDVEDGGAAFTAVCGRRRRAVGSGGWCTRGVWRRRRRRR